MKVLQDTKLELQEKKQHLVSQLPKLREGNVLIVGDVCLDEYLFGEVKRISPEAPVPVLDVQSEESRLGLSANVAQNIVSLGGSCQLLSVTGKDHTASRLRSLLQQSGVSSEYLIEDESRPTIKKTRLIAGNHHIARMDFEKRIFLSPKIKKKLLEQVESLIGSVDVVILEDYAKGVFSEDVAQGIIQLAHGNHKKVFVDPHRSTPVRYYKNADVFKPNRDEAYILSGLNIDDLRDSDGTLFDIAESLKSQLQCSDLIITLGKQGMIHFAKDRTYQLPTEARQIFDVTGAGDTVIATLALSNAVGIELEEACILANLAAGVVVSKVGCVPCHYEELLSSLNQIP